jgi:hypothetical protein
MKAHVIELLRKSAKRVLEVAQAVPESKLGEGHGKELFPAREASDAMVAVITSYATIELVVGKFLNELSEDSLAKVHRDSPEMVISGK